MIIDEGISKAPWLLKGAFFKFLSSPDARQGKAISASGVDFQGLHKRQCFNKGICVYLLDASFTIHMAA